MLYTVSTSIKSPILRSNLIITCVLDLIVLVIDPSSLR